MKSDKQKSIMDGWKQLAESVEACCFFVSSNTVISDKKNALEFTAGIQESIGQIHRELDLMHRRSLLYLRLCMDGRR